MKTTIGIRELYQNLRKVIIAIQAGQKITVTRHAKELFVIVPIAAAKSYKKYKLSDFKKLAVKTDDAKMSAEIDKILYS